ncbi:MAG TPA: matrixin family metalloprotease [Pyrinomonadaceae bacterium]|nr:matrixin family metalloprotease [Pyrinomonadaceae bacterium]
MNRKLTSISLTICMVLMTVVTTRAGGALESIDITNADPSPIPGHILAHVIGIRWDVRSIPVQYRINNTLNPVPNPLGAPFLSVADATTALQASFDAWNSIPTSYIDMHIVGTTSNPGLVGFNFVNELTFRTSAGFNAIASSPSTNLISDVTLENGDDLDGDGDSDVSSAITTAQDVDNDGDIEFPAGFYKAGTILDNDVQFNTKVTNGFRFTVGAANADTNTRSVDLNCVATHEFGHSFGLSHVLNNQNSATDGDGSTMFPFIDTGDPAAELGQAQLSADDIAFASFFYPEGSAASGPAALQPGDVPFNSAYGLITGELRHGVLNQPIAGGSVYAIDRNTNAVMAGAFSGTTNLSFNPANGGLFFVPNVAQAIPNGNYTIPVPQGNYNLNIEATDGSPVAAANISFTCQIGNFFGQQNFIEEFYNNNSEAAIERDPGDAKNVHVNAGQVTAGNNITTNDVFNISNFGARNAIGFINSPAARTYAVAFPVSQITALNGGAPTLIEAGLFDTAVVDASVPVVFGKAWLTTGVINSNGTATIDLVNPLDSAVAFVGQDTDFAPFYFKNPQDLTETVREGIANGSIQNLFLVLQIPSTTPFPGVSGQPPLIGLNTTGTIFGLSFLSSDGGLTFTRRNDLNFRFSLIASKVPQPPA